MKYNLPDFKNCKILIIGLGYVGLPLALEFAKTKICKKTGIKLGREVTGYDINQNRINDLKKGIDLTNELNEDELTELGLIKFTITRL